MAVTEVSRQQWQAGLHISAVAVPALHWRTLLQTRRAGDLHGAAGLRQVSEDAVLNANYLLANLRDRCDKWLREYSGDVPEGR